MKKNTSKVKKQEKDTTYPKVVVIEGALMGNGEFIHYGKSLGFINERQRDLIESGAHKIARGTEPVVALGDRVA